MFAITIIINIFICLLKYTYPLLSSHLIIHTTYEYRLDVITSILWNTLDKIGHQLEANNDNSPENLSSSIIYF